MDDQAWMRIQSILEKALELPPDAAEAFVADACAGDDALRHEIEALIAADRSAPGFLDRRGFVVSSEPEPDRSGTMLGPFRIGREIGRGGMSAVFEAVRTEPFEQVVAIKILQRDGSSGDLAARLHAERQILALLDHPGIVRILDGGITPDGRPYLVMDRVDGERIDAWCDRRRLSVRQRLRLLLQVIDAVAYAHRSLIVHRDLKPANLLVTEAGEAKLLDFGIAKILQPGSGMEAVTRTGVRALTPEYAAPEQIRGERITTACDIYALGVLLFEILTGERPYRLESPTPWEVEQAVLETEPERPSMAVDRTIRSATGTAEAIARARRTEPARLRMTLDGDLDAIVLKALRKEPEERYASADAMAEDIERYLGSLPVVARRGSRAYRARKFVARHRRGVGIGIVLVVLAISGMAAIISAWGAAERARDRAQREARTATEVTEFLVDVFGGSDPLAQLGESVDAGTLLTRGRERIRVELLDEPGVRASMLAAIGEVYSNLGRYETADTLLREALAVRAAQLGKRRHLGRGDPGEDRRKRGARARLSDGRKVRAAGARRVCCVSGDRGPARLPPLRARRRAPGNGPAGFREGRDRGVAAARPHCGGYGVGGTPQAGAHAGHGAARRGEVRQRRRRVSEAAAGDGRDLRARARHVWPGPE